MSWSRIEQALEHAMDVRLRVYSTIPILLAMLFFGAAFIQKGSEQIAYVSFGTGLVCVLLVISSLIMRFRPLKWRVKLVVYVAPTLVAGLVAYGSIGNSAAAYAGVYFALMLSSLAYSKRAMWRFSATIILVTLCLNYWHYQGLPPDSLPSHLEFVWNNQLQMGFIGFCYVLALVLAIVLLLPPAQTLEQISTQQAVIEQEISMRLLGVSSSKAALFKRLSGFTVELDQDNRVCNLSLEAQNQLKEQAVDPKPYSETKLATINSLPELIDAARITGSSYTAIVDPGLISKQACKLTVTPYLTNQSAQHLILSATSTVTQHAQSSPLLAQTLSEYLKSAQTLSGELTFIGYRLLASSEPRDELNTLNIELKRIVDQSGAFSYRFLGNESVYGYLAALHLNRAGQDAFKVMLKHLYQERSKTGKTLSLVLLQQHIVPSEFHLATAQALKLKAFLESHNQPEFFEAPQNMNARWSSDERDRLKQGLINNEIRWSIVDILNARDDLPPIKELKLHWNDKTQPEKTSEELIVALQSYGLSNALARIHSTQLLPMIKLGQDRSFVDNVALLIPEKILLNLANFSAMCSLLMDFDIVPERLWLRIHESSASQLTPEHWQKLEDLKSKGFKFALGEVGAGDTDIKLLAHPLFNMAHFSRAMTKAAAESTRASLIFQASLEIAQSLNLVTMAKAVNEPLYIHYLKKSGVDYIDIA